LVQFKIRKREESMKKFVALLIITSVVVGIAFAGCAQPTTPAEPTAPTAPAENPLEGVAIKPDGTPYKFVCSTAHLSADFMKVCDGIYLELVNRAGGEASTLNADFNLESQQSAVEDIIQSGAYDGLMFHPVDSDALVPVIDQAMASGIPVFVYDILINTSATCQSRFDAVEMGRAAGQYVVDYAEETGTQITVFELWGLMSMEGAQQRHKGFNEACDLSSLVTVIESADTGWQDENALAFLLDALPAHPEINAVFTQGAMISGTKQALDSLDRLETVGQPGHVLWVGCDECPVAVGTLRAGYTDGIASHSPWEIMDGACKAMLTYVCCGRDVPEIVTYDTRIVTPANIDDVPRWGAPLVWGDMFNDYPDFADWPTLDIPELPTPTEDMKQAGY
jgi:ribose transport system substrate-binding protein